MKLNFREYGAGKPIVLLHAFPLSSSMWNEQVGSIIDEGWRVILPDFPGFGESKIENQSKISRIEDLAKAVSKLLSTLNIEQAIIGGLSMGGYVALNVVRMFPEKVFGLILADTSAAADSEEKRASRFSLINKVRETGVEILIDEMLPNVVSEYTKSNNTELVAMLENDFKRATKDGVIISSRGMAERRELINFLKEINVPTLLVFGEEDKITNLDAARTLNREIEHSTLVTIPNAGHYSNLEQSEAFNNAIVNFLKQLK